ncbi:hypothetical protein [Maricaulis sp. CAU 1757]
MPRLMSCLTVLAVLFLAACSDRDAATGEAADALARMGLVAQSGDGPVMHAGYEQADNTHVFTEVVFTHEPVDTAAGDEADVILVGRLSVVAPRLADNGDLRFDRLVLEDIRTAPQAEGRLALDRVEVAGPNVTLAADIADHLAAGLGGEGLVGWELYTFDTVRFSGLELDDGDIRDPLNVRLESLELGDLDTSRLAAFALRNFVVSQSGTEAAPAIRVGEVTLSGIETSVFAGLMDTLFAGDRGEDPLAPYYGAALGTPTSGFETMQAVDLAFDADGLMVTVERIRAEVEESRTGLVSEFSLTGGRLSADATRPGGALVGQWLAMLDYDGLDFSVTARSIYDSETGRLRTDGVNALDVSDALRIDFSQELSGYDAYLEAAGAAGAAERGKAALDTVRLDRMRLTLTDQSFLDRLLTALARPQGMTARELRSQAPLLVAMGLATAPAEIPRPLVSDLSLALSDFLVRGGGLVIELEPAPPIPLGELEAQQADGTLDLERLGLSVSHQPPN